MPQTANKASTWKIGVIAAILCGIGYASIVAYYYFTTDPSAVVVSCDKFPTGVSARFTEDAAIDRVVAHLEDMLTTADSAVLTSMARQEGLGPMAIREKVVPPTGSGIPSPVFNQEWKGLTLNLARKMGMSLRANEFLEIELIGMPKEGWRLVAYIKKRPAFTPVPAGIAPRSGGPCTDLESCANDLSEQVLRSLESRSLLSYYIHLDTVDANQNILDLYENTIKQNTVTPDDLVAWGNAFYSLQRYDDALGKYQEALRRGTNSFPAHIARGLVYYSRPHDNHVVDDLRVAEEEFRWGVRERQDNLVAEANLCNTLIREWANTPGHSPESLTEARQHCEQALKIDPHFVIAAVDIGYIKYRIGQHDEALRYFDQISQEYPNSSIVFVNQGYFLYCEYLAGNGDALDRAIEKTLKAWSLNSHSYVAANNLGYFYYERGDFSEATEFWRRANVLNGNDADCLAGLALGSYKLGQKQEASSYLQRAIRLDPHYRTPDYLKKNVDWSAQAASDLAELIKMLPASGPG